MARKIWPLCLYCMVWHVWSLRYLHFDISVHSSYGNQVLMTINTAYQISANKSMIFEHVILGLFYEHFYATLL